MQDLFFYPFVQAVDTAGEDDNYDDLTHHTMEFFEACSKLIAALAQ